ncbi:type 1 fimbrial protein [Salmonella enterica]|nr:type 1 fimbrial protein [Salmonella enterica subsp. enterica serovar Poona]EAO9157830.1 type 1 fimbrial protein [Salmonella enterica]ECX6011856.1 type 1 fimbrial protein [Salmonella enterica subsp. enterica serovar Rubislaw]EBL1739975.1 type 1 fimbrial protein [Salmonella enterica]EBU7357274.1 type 1 fimbrial protein [Salmonella enterica subsp. enterica serovar Poona]
MFLLRDGRTPGGREYRRKAKIILRNYVMRFSTNKAILAVAVCSSFVCASAAMAAKGNSVTMHFVGSVTDSTCDVRPFNSAGVDATTINIGTVKPDGSQAEAPVNFYLKPVNCDVKTIKSTHASILWASSGLSDIGLLNTHGSATGVHVKLMPVNEGGANTIDTGNGVQADNIIKEGGNIVYYKGTSALTGSFAYKVGLEVDSGATLGAGTVDADATYTVAYN